MTDEATYRPATPDDLPLVTETLYLALSWDPEDPIPPFEVVVSHPEIAKYHDGWMRPGDAGVVAEIDGAFAGMAYLRLFTDDDHGQGFYDADTPELAVGVRHDFRGSGIGTRLMQELERQARNRGVPRISLSVSKGNPAANLYVRLGYRWVSDEDDELMVLDLT
ncbi:MAG: GNAT family N-acetyltransferase [Acidimicrobiia bacterium]|nr:GNAT family N-acetyltransferase [Acidimicrobiia bacterium]